MPNLGPKALKLGLTFLTRIPEELLINSTFFTLTSDLIKKNILNYKEFSELKIITSYTTTDGERRTSSKTIKMTEI